MNRKRWLLLCGVWLVLAWGTPSHSGGQGPVAQFDNASMLPAGPGAKLTLKGCATCHTVENFVGLRRSAADWNDTVTFMIAVGAPIDQEEARVIVGYLAEVFGPASPPLVDANRGTREDFEKLPGLHAQTIAKLIEHRRRQGNFKTLAQVRELLGFKTSEKVQGYLVVRP